MNKIFESLPINYDTVPVCTAKAQVNIKHQGVLNCFNIYYKLLIL